MPETSTNIRRSAVFTILSSIIILSVLTSIALTEIPDNVIPPTQSILEGRSYAVLPTSELHSSFLSGNLQKQTDQYLADRIPFRDDVLLDNAALQRKMIAFANVIPRYPAYHTFYGSDRIVSPSTRMIFRNPASNITYPESYFKLQESFFTGIMKENDELNWYYYLPDSQEITQANPAHALVSQHIDYDYIKNRILDSAPTNLQFISNNYSSEDEYSKYFFSTDHHFQIEGAIDFYNCTCKAIGITPANLSGIYTAYEGPYMGSNGRTGLVREYSDAIRDVPFSIDEVIATSNDKTLNPAEIDEQYGKASDFKQGSRFENVYVTWFHSSPNPLEYNNTTLKNGKSLLLISDSYDDSSDRFFIANYEHVYEIDPRSYPEGIKGMQIFIDEHPDINDVVLVISCDVFYQMEKAGVL